jgi:hypothetical protein
MANRDMLNPIRYGVFALEIWSHKVLRWLVPFFLVALLATNGGLAGQSAVFSITLTLQLAFYMLAAGAFFARHYCVVPAILNVPLYFCMVNLAAARGIIEAHLGKSYTTWNPVRAG